MNADAFTRRWIGLFALLAGLTALAPWFIHAVVQNSGCQETVGACATTTETLTLYGHRLILAVFLVPLLLALAGRALSVGAFVWAFPFALLMIAGAAPLFFEAAAFVATRDPVEWLAAPAIMPLMFLLLLLVALSAYPDDDIGGTAPAWRAALGFVAAAALFVTASAWLPGVAVLPWVGRFAHPVADLAARGHAALGITGIEASLGTYCLIAFAFGAAGLVASRGGGAPQRRIVRA